MSYSPIFNKRRVTGLILTLSALILTLLALVLDLRPLIPHPGPLSDAQKQAVEDLIVDNSPAQLGSYGEKEIVLETSELTLLGRFALENIPPLQEMALDTRLGESEALLMLSIPQQAGPLRWHINIRANLALSGERITLETIRIGQLRLPGLARPLVNRRLEALLLQQNLNYSELLKLQDSIHSIAINDGELRLQVSWESALLTELSNQAQQMLLGEDEQLRIHHYYSLSRTIAQNLPGDNRSASVQELLPELFRSAMHRSTSPTEAVLENRALLQALAIYINRVDPRMLLGTLSEGALPDHAARLTLQRRNDLARHFLTSAAISASAGSSIAEVLSNSKELHDARHSTGFSFSDLTANMAGAQIGELASDSNRARQLQLQMAQAGSESAYMPEVSRENDGLNEPTFRARFGNRDNPAWQQELAAISQQVRALPIYKQVTGIQ